MASLYALSPLGKRAPTVEKIGPVTITERMDLALASLAARRGQDLGPAAKAAGLPLPPPLRYEQGAPYAAFWVQPETWFVEAPFATHELIEDLLRAAFGQKASITEQTDGWVIFELTGADLVPMFERLTNVDLVKVPEDYATRTAIEHLGCFLVKFSRGHVRLYGPRSAARSLLHALKAAAQSVY